MDENLSTLQRPAGVELDAAEQQSFVSAVFGWMFLGLAMTAGVAAWFAAQENMLQYFEDHGLVFFLVILAQLGLVIWLSAGINRMSAQVAVFSFVLYSALTGFTLSMILEVYTTASIASAFGISAAMFGGMAAIGYVTKRDLTKMGSILIMALFGLIAAMIVNVFVASSALYWVVNFAGVIIFAGLTAYDMQKVKQIGAMGLEGEQGKKAAILGALSLYLDFLNLFLFMLRIFGSAR
jgi:FtsH-binding integral membrane protein